MIEVVRIDDGLLNGGREGVNMRVIGREMGLIEGSVEWVGAVVWRLVWKGESKDDLFLQS